ncbi:UDP-glucose/GDP-mannose dehydrogenase family protein [Luteimonas pelagia]
MRIAIFGTGYVGLVTGACLADVGHDVACVDIDHARIDALRAGRVPIHEAGLDPLVASNLAAGRLGFTTSPDEALASADVAMIAVGTPPGEDGAADLRHVLAVARTIGEHVEAPLLVVVKSTVPVGTTDQVRDVIARTLSARGAAVEVDVASNPEFLKEGAAVEDFMRPDRIVVGTDGGRALETLRRLYAPFNRRRDRLVPMDVRSAELTKYAANAMLAARISLMNEIASIASHVGADVELVRQGIGADPRIGLQFLYPGAGYGGSCFPKDVRALAATARRSGAEPRMLDAVEAVNEAQKQVLPRLIEAFFAGAAGLAGRTIAVWGLAFKPGTDDMREAPSRALLEALWAAGARVRAHDPAAMAEARRLYGARDDLVLCDDPYAALDGADALVVVTEWKAYRSPDFERLRAALADAVVFDGRNIYDPAHVEAHGLAYHGIGRGRRPRGQEAG